MHGEFCWNELATHDIQKAMAFYAETLGWEFEPFTILDGEYYVAKAGGKFVAGIGGFDTAAVPGTNYPTWFAVIHVDNIDERLAKAVSLGATVIKPAEDVPGIGRFAVLRDPTGGAICWLMPATNMEGPG